MNRKEIIARMAALLLDAKDNIDNPENFGKIMEVIARLAGGSKSQVEEIVLQVVPLPLPNCCDPRCPIHGQAMCN